MGRLVMGAWVVIITLFGGISCNGVGGASCSWGCLPIKECKVIYIDLITAKLAREKQQNQKVEKIISLVRGYVCDDKAEYVCCPKYMGQFNNNITNMVNTVYAISMYSVMVRSNMEEKRWTNTEAFFWRDESCFPWLDYQTDLDPDLDLDSNSLDGDDENLEETRILLPGTLTVEDIRCLSVWDGDTEVGSALLAWDE